VSGDTRSDLADQALAGYVNGPGAVVEATNRALKKIDGCETIIVVEGISDQIAIETLALRHERDLDAEGVAVLPIGGAHAIGRFLLQFGPAGEHMDLTGFCDADATETFRQGLIKAGVGQPRNAEEMADVGFHVCVRDLEDELIRAVGPDQVVAVVASQGELAPFKTFQKQPEWRGRPLDDQLHRFLGSKARRSLRYARLLMSAVDLERAPQPLAAVLNHI
jgi:hypothetical protein